MGTDTITNGKSNRVSEISPISRLIQIGRKKAFVTINDILQFFPDAEQDVAKLEEAFAALISAGIPYIEDADLLVDPSDEDIKRAKEEQEQEEKEDEENKFSSAEPIFKRGYFVEAWLCEEPSNAISAR